VPPRALQTCAEIKDVFNNRTNFRLHPKISRILHLHDHRHTAAVYAFRCTNLGQLTPGRVLLK